jgi:hypothetical protein
MMDDLTRRAFAAYYRTEGDANARTEGDANARTEGDANAVVDQPADTSGVVEHEGKTYVVLHNARGTLAVYRVRNSGLLKRLRRWPAALD